MQETNQDEWDKFFGDRARLRTETAGAHFATFAAGHPYEVFIGPPTKQVREREPAFGTLEQAQRWARGRSDGQEWRIRHALTGELLYDSVNNSGS